MKLELKHLAPYLPYGLSVCRHNNKKYILELIGLDEDYLKLLDLKHKDMVSLKSRWHDVSENKPILRPLSDLTKEINHNGKDFEPFEILQEEFNNSLELNGTNSNKSFFIGLDSFVRFDDIHRIYEFLFEWHFDVFGLIEKGLAIDINTLNS